LPVPTPWFGMSLVVATIVTVPSDSVTPVRTALPLPSIVTGPAPSICPPTVNVTVPVVIGWPSPVTWTMSVPCQPAMPVSVSGSQPGVGEPDGQSTCPAVGFVKVTTGAEPTVTLQGTGASVVRLPAGSLSVAVTL